MKPFALSAGLALATVLGFAVVTGLRMPAAAAVTLGLGLAAGWLYALAGQRRQGRRQLLAQRAAALQEAERCAGPAAMVWEADPRSLRFRSISSNVSTLLGVSPGAWLAEAEPWAQRLHPEDRQATVARRRAAADQGEEHWLEYRLLRPDGTACWIRDHAWIEQDPGAPPALRGVMSDVSEFKAQAQRAQSQAIRLQEQENELERITAAAPGVICTLEGNAEGSTRVVRASVACRRITGLEADAVTSDPAALVALMAPADQRRWHDSLAASRAQLSPWHCRLRLNRPDGIEVRIEASGLPEWLPDGRVRWLAYLTDVTSQSRAEEALRLSEARLDGIIDSAIDAIITVNADTRVVLFNAAAERMFGYPRAALLGEPLERLIPERFWRSHAEHFAAFGAGGETNRRMGGAREVAGRRASGEEFPIEASISQVALDGQKLFTVILRDVSERQAEARRRRELEQRLLQAQKLETLGALTGALAHEFNNLLTGILVHLDLTLQSQPAGSQTWERLERARGGALGARELVKRLMLFARRRPESTITAVDFGALVRDTAPLLSTTAGAAIAVSAVVPEEAYYVRGDASQLQQMLMNLGINAAQAIRPHAGTITLELDRVEHAGTDDPEGLPSACAPGPYARLRIHDTGCGMDQETQRRIFEPFFTTKKPGQASGLGLAIVHGVVFAHAGAIRVRSAVGQGSTFGVFLPLCAAPQEPAAGLPAPTAQAGDCRVLVVDDEPDIAAVLSSALRERGTAVEAFTEPEEALTSFLAHPATFDAAILDLSMPGLSGIDLAKRLRHDRPHLVLILVSGDLDWHDLSEVPDAGRTLLLRKPFTLEELARVLERAQTLIAANRAAPPR